LKQAEVAYETLKFPEQKARPLLSRDRHWFFRWILKEIDARGTMLRGKLVLTAGGLEIDCVMNKDRVREARNSFDKHVIIEGAAHYDAKRQIPARLDIKSLKVVGDGSNLLRWRGAFKSSDDANDDWDDVDWVTSYPIYFGIHACSNAILRDERATYDVDSIEQYLQEAKAGKHRIYTSSIALAEVVPSAITKPGIGFVSRFHR